MPITLILNLGHIYFLKLFITPFVQSFVLFYVFICVACRDTQDVWFRRASVQNNSLIVDHSSSWPWELPPILQTDIWVLIFPAPPPGGPKSHPFEESQKEKFSHPSFTGEARAQEKMTSRLAIRQS